MAGEPVARSLRAFVFVDFWNFSLELNRVEGARFDADFKKLGHVLSKAAVDEVEKGATPDFAGMNVYISSNMQSQAEAGLRRWASFIDTFPGLNVRMVPRKKEKEGPKCPNDDCHKTVDNCPHCGKDMRGTMEKGVDVKIATDMLTLGWDDTYDVGVLVSADSDYVPVAEYLKTKGKKIIHAQFPPSGFELSQKCWGRINLTSLRSQFKMVRPQPTPAAKSSPTFSRRFPLKPAK